jgi:hypothetical protein
MKQDLKLSEYAKGGMKVSFVDTKKLFSLDYPVTWLRRDIQL